jgi:hypothetical protein
MNDGSSLPNELDACHRLIAQLTAQRDHLSSRLHSQDAQLEQQAHDGESRDAFVEEQSRTVVNLDASHQELLQENEELKLTIQKLLDRLYGRRTERFIDPDQMGLDFGDDPEAAALALEEAVLEAERTLDEVESKRKSKRKRKPKRSKKFPEHLPRCEKIVDLPEDEKEGLEFIGYDEVETLEFVRAILRVRVTKFAKYSDPAKGVASPERPIFQTHDAGIS